MSTLVELADRIWRGEAPIDEHHPVHPQSSVLEEVASGIAFSHALGNAVVVDAGDVLFMVDGGADTHARVREWSAKRLDTAVYSHGHVDHVFGVRAFDAEAEGRGWPTPRVVAHEALPRRFERYVLTAGYNGVINQRQFQFAQALWPTHYRYPDETYRDARSLRAGDLDVELHHARGETDDHTWTWIPAKRLICCGDLFIWATPNGGNPQKVQRYPREWAAALRDMAALDAEMLLPGHGYPVVGAERVREALTTTAELLESLVEQTLELMNAGAPLDEVLHSVGVPPHLAHTPWLQPVYDEPEFIVRNIWRLYGGWYDGDPASLKPAPRAALAAELAALSGGAAALARRALELSAAGEHRLACHLAELAALADARQHGARAEVYERRLAAERSTMARGIYAWAARESRDRR